MLPVCEQREHFLTFLEVTIEERKINLGNKILDYCIANDRCIEFEIMKLRLKFELPEDSAKDDAIEELSKLAKQPEDVLLLCQWFHDRARDEEARQWLCTPAESNAKGPPPWEIWSQVNLALYHKQKDINYLVDAFRGITNRLILSPERSLTLTLRLLRICFKRDIPQIFAVLESELPKLPVYVWIPVLPQILSRLVSRNAQLRILLETILIYVDQTRPQAIMFPLMVPLSLEKTERQRIACGIVLRIAQVHPTLYEAVISLSTELVRISTT